MGDTNLKTITFDPAVYKLVPVSSSADMREAASKADDEGFEEGRTHGASGTEIYEAMLAAVPEQLPRVVVHSGEPTAWRVHKKAKGEPLTLGYDGPALFHDRAWAESWMHEQIDFKGFAGAWIENLYTHPAPSQPSAEALVQAALEAALDAVQNVEINCDASGAAIGSAERRIRALSPKQIIESCKEKS